MKDFIFITGTSGIGKSTLAKGLLEHYKTTYIEQWMIPEFYSRDGSEEMTGELEELTCWENQVAMMFCFNKLGFKNIIASDIDDLRTGDIPIIFKGYEYITIKLICNDSNQLHIQMKNRPNGLIDYELQQKLNVKVMKRPPLINEVELDVTGLSINDVLLKAINIIDISKSKQEYDYEKPSKKMFYSWVPSNGLR
jgi:energy-coupling factor transporter ATP-binding protein EcfA2